MKRKVNGLAGWLALRSVVVIVIVGLFWGAVGPMVVAAGSFPHPLRGGPTRNKDDEMEECAWCSGVGTIDPPESDLELARWEAEVDRGIQAHRERNLGW